MRLSKTVDINIDRCKSKVDYTFKDAEYNIVPLYTEEEKEALRKVYDLFESGNFEEALKIFLSLNDELKESVDYKVMDVLLDIDDGAIYQIEEMEKDDE